MGHPSRVQGFSETGKGGRRESLIARVENKHQPPAKYWEAKVRKLDTKYLI